MFLPPLLNPFKYLLIILFLGWPLQIIAQPEGSDLQDIETAIQQDTQLSNQTKNALLNYLRKIENEAAQTRGQESTWDKILKKLSFKTTFRLRHESNFELDNQKDRHRQRIKFCFSTYYNLNDELTFGARLTSGDPDDPNSPHVTLGDLSDSFELSLDRAFVKYQPQQISGLEIVAGKFGHPFYRNPVYGELVWDADVQPEGVTATYKVQGLELDLLKNLVITAGEYILIEQSQASEALLTVAQIQSKHAFSTDCHLNVGIGYYLYSDTTPNNSTKVLGDNQGNATRDRDNDGNADDLRAKFGIFNPIIALNTQACEIPLTLSAEYILNTLKAGSKNQGWAFGFKIGKIQALHDWQAYYQWQVVEQEAVFSPYVQDDFLLGSNHRSHIFGIKLQAIENAQLHLWGLVSSRDKRSPTPGRTSGNDQWRVRLDINFSF